MGSRLWIWGGLARLHSAVKELPKLGSFKPQVSLFFLLLSPGALIWVVLIVGEICWNELCLPHRDIRAAEGQGQ